MQVRGLIKVPGLSLKVESQDFGLVAVVFAAKFELQSRSPVAALVDKLRHALGTSSVAPVMTCPMPLGSTLALVTFGLRNASFVFDGPS